MQKRWHLTTISKILATKLEHKQRNGYLNVTRSNSVKVQPVCGVRSEGNETG